MNPPKYAYFQGNIVPYEQAKVGVATHALNYGTAAFGGLRGYWNGDQEQLFLFRPQQHLTRLLNSGKLLAAKFDQTPESLTRVVIDLIRTEGLREDCYVRPLLYKADEMIGVRLHDLQDEITIFAVPFKQYVKNDTNAHVTISSWRRVDDNAIPARGKISGAYINSALIKTDAVRSGFDEALVLTNEGHLSEGSAMNVFLVRDGKIHTPSITENILEGITRSTVIQLAQKELDITVVERAIDRTEIYLADEIFMTGTAAQIVAVTQVDHRGIGDGHMGPITSQIRALYDQAVRGQLSAYLNWVEPVYS